jgi:4a-hydroxytetrahydrobiopterin dehydratase
MERLSAFRPRVRRILNGMKTIAEDEARTRLQRLPGWALKGHAIQRQFTCAGFPEAVAFLVRLAFDAEAADHPDVQLSYKRLTLTYSTHSAGGLTDKDFEGAARASDIARASGAS